MMIRTSLVALAVVAALAGCATTDSQDGTSGNAASSDSRSVARVDLTGNSGSGMGERIGSSFEKRSVYYEFDGYDVKPEYQPLVEAHAKYLRQNPQASIKIEGNTDERGSREYNVALGQKRAESVTNMMKLLGVKESQIEAVSFGKEKPRAQGHDETAWAENRRSDFQHGR